MESHLSLADYLPCFKFHLKHIARERLPNIKVSKIFRLTIFRS